VKTEVIHGLPFDDYLAIEAESKSGITPIATSPGLYHHQKTHGWEPSAATQKVLDFGSAVDCLLFDGADSFALAYAVRPPGLDMRRKAGKDWAKEQENKTIVPRSVVDCAEAVALHPLYERYLQGGESQLSATWQDEDSGLWCKCRPDYALDGIGTCGNGSMLTDLKTSATADPREWTRIAHRLKYHWQVAMYLDGMTAATGVDHDRFYFVVAEREPPHRVEIFETPASIIEQGRAEYKAALMQVKACRDADYWPTSTGEVQTMEFERWMR
jgi:exodeoxyribonuclease VIII